MTGPLCSAEAPRPLPTGRRRAGPTASPPGTASSSPKQSRLDAAHGRSTADGCRADALEPRRQAAPSGRRRPLCHLCGVRAGPHRSGPHSSPPASRGCPGPKSRCGPRQALPRGSGLEDWKPYVAMPATEPAQASPGNSSRPRVFVMTSAFIASIRLFPDMNLLRPPWPTAGLRTRTSVASISAVWPVAPRCPMTSVSVGSLSPPSMRQPRAASKSPISPDSPGEGGAVDLEPAGEIVMRDAVPQVDQGHQEAVEEHPHVLRTSSDGPPTWLAEKLSVLPGLPDRPQLRCQIGNHRRGKPRDPTLRPGQPTSPNPHHEQPNETTGQLSRQPCARSLGHPFWAHVLVSAGPLPGPSGKLG